MNAECFYKLTYGLYAICSFDGPKLNGYISNTVMQITADPCTIATSCSKNNFTCDMIKKSGLFSISVIDQEDVKKVIAPFGYRSGRDIEKFADFKYKIGKSGCPILLEDTIAWFECKVIQQIDVGTHIIFIGDVIENNIENDQIPPMTYTYFREIKKGKSPKNAPTYIDPKK